MSVVTPPDYQFVLYDSVGWTSLGILPLVNVKWSHGLGGLGSIEAQLPLTSPMATLTNIQTVTREIAVWRNGVPVMMGPIIACTPNLKDQMFNITCATPWWWMSKRANEVANTFAIGADVGASIWTLINTAQGLAPNGTAHITQSPSYPGSTFTYTSAYVLTGVENDPVSKLVEDQSILYPGFDFEISYAANVGNMQVTRYFNVFSPFKTATADRPLTEADLIDFTMPENGSDVITRARDFAIVTDEAGTSGTLVSAVNDSALTSLALPMVTGMFTRDAPDQTTLDTWSKGDLFLHKWPQRTYTATYTPSPAVPFGAYNTGDLVPLNVAFPYFSVKSSQRLVAYTVSWAGGEGVDETIELIFNDPVKTSP